MARIVMGNRDGAEALRQARTVLTELNAEWPDVPITQRTVRGSEPDALAQALLAGEIGLAVQAADTLPLTLPEGVKLAAVTRRQEARSALVTRGDRTLEAMEDGAIVAVQAGRDEAVLAALRPDLTLEPLGAHLDDDLARLTRDEVHALLLPAATLLTLDHRNRLSVLLDPEVFPPAPGQGALAILVREDDDAAFELAYTLQHRASFDRVKAERAFAAGLKGELVGALASVDADGDLSLFGAVFHEGTTMQASTTGDASDAVTMGQELASDVREQLAALS